MDFSDSLQDKVSDINYADYKSWGSGPGDDLTEPTGTPVEETCIDKHSSTEEEQCETEFLQGVSHNSEGQHMVRLPIKGDLSALDNSKVSAVEKFYKLETRLSR
ncbi:hypothetical protein PR048_021069 [Dryococelus australis]|uniref:Uncharacterized protein n=1 Tax=Dryococelus australis TaxID=614101 RepID=A0ABQ9GX72_9NEOP|nr:hypothetical protein PR048_021069 [Dryococelus australis]